MPEATRLSNDFYFVSTKLKICYHNDQPYYLDFYRISPVFVTVLNGIFQILFPPMQPSLNYCHLPITRFLNLQILKRDDFTQCQTPTFLIIDFPKSNLPRVL